MNHQEKLDWMALWAARNNCQLALEGECGFGRECVGILAGDCFPDYEWYDDDTYERSDQNGDVWIPPDAYHKHPCVAVLGRGGDAESQLYDWLKWFEDNRFTLERGIKEDFKPKHLLIEVMLGRYEYRRMVRQAA